MKLQSLLAVLAIASLHAQPAPAADPYVKDPTQLPGKPERAGPRNISLCYETYSVPIALAARLRRERKTDAELYTLLSTATDKNGIHQESFDIVRCKSGNQAVAKGITEEIYPTEYEPAAVPATVGFAITPPSGNGTPAPGPPSAGGTSGPPGAATPCAFDTRNVGRTVEAEATMGEDPDPFVDIRMSLDHVTAAGRCSWGQGISKTEMPVFESQRLNTAIVVRANQPALVGTLNRPPVSQVDPDSAKRVWFAFVTVKTVKP